MPGIVRVRDDPKLKHAGARHDPLDEVDLGLVDFGNDDLDLVETVAADGDLLLTAGIDPATDRADELVHVDRSGPADHRIATLVGRGSSRRKRAKVGVLQLQGRDGLQRGLAFAGIFRGEPHHERVARTTFDGAEAGLRRHEHLLERHDRVVDGGTRLPRRVDLIDEDHAPLQIDAEPRWPSEAHDRGAGGEGYEHRRDPPPHVSCPQASRHEPRQQRRAGDGQEREAPHGPGLPPPRYHGRRDIGGGLTEQSGREKESVHASSLVVPLASASPPRSPTTPAMLDSVTVIRAVSSILSVTRSPSRSTLATVP